MDGSGQEWTEVDGVDRNKVESPQTHNKYVP